jgi:shikimate kinase/3-dehydroquinate synthase
VEALSRQRARTLPARPRGAGGALVFIGFMGAGKSTAARAISNDRGTRALDSDRELEARLGEPIESYFDREGETAFRAREEELVLELLDRSGGGVVALGGGAPGSERVREALAAHTVVHLEVEADEAWRRASGKGRPLARERGRFDQLHGDRSALYESIADATLPAGDRDTARDALPALLALNEARTAAGGPVRLVWARTASGDYPVYFGAGLVEGAFLWPQDGRRFVITDANVAAHHRLTGVQHTIAVDAGEQAKTLAAAEDALRRLARAGADRSDLVVAVGGGVVGDLAGFCAAVYQRGMRYLQVPTTLVAQVDSAYGGKTGVDLPEGKNYAGAYHQPSAVICDPAVLATLPARELAAGYVEVLKTALIAGGPLWARVRNGGEVDNATILGCLRTKLAVVASDERDAGARQVLNLGHTVGHAIEAATGYARYRHGEAVGIGLLAALRLSGRAALRDEVAELLAARGLPLTFDGASADEVVELCARDKKRTDGRLPLVLVAAPGDVTPGHEVPPASLHDAVAELCAG